MQAYFALKFAQVKVAIMGMDDAEETWVEELEAGGEARSTSKVPWSSSRPGPVGVSSSSETRFQTTSKMVVSSKIAKLVVVMVRESQRAARWCCGEGLR